MRLFVCHGCAGQAVSEFDLDERVKAKTILLSEACKRVIAIRNENAPS